MTDEFHAPPVPPSNVVRPETWEEAYRAMVRKLMDPGAPDVDLSDLPSPGLLADEIVSVQPMTAPVAEVFAMTYGEETDDE